MRAPDRAVGLIIVAVVVVGCGASGPTPVVPTPTPVAPTATPVEPAPAPGTMPVAASPSGSAAPLSIGPSLTFAGASPAGSAPFPSTTVDAVLLAILPATVGGARIVETPEAAHGSVGDPSIARIASRLATGYVVSDSGDDWAVVSVVALRPGTWSPEFYRDWRDSYNASVCEQEGGVGGRAVATIGGREVDIATCGGLRTYHVHIPDGDLIVAVASVGQERFGELLVAGLRP